MRNIKKTFKIICLGIILCFPVISHVQCLGAQMSVSTESPAPAFASTSAKSVKKGLVHGKKGYCYYVNGKKLTNTWKTVKGKKYYFQANGYAAVGGTVISNRAYVFDVKGRLLVSSGARFARVGKYYYYVNKSGAAYTGWFIVKNKLYYGDSRGRLKRNTVYQSISFGPHCDAQPGTETDQRIQDIRKLTEKKGYCYYVNGKKLTNTWETIKGHKYYFQSNGYAAVGPVKIKGQYYVFNEKGCLLTPKKTSAVKVNRAYYYVSPKGKPVPGYHLILGRLYYVSPNGRCTLQKGKEWKTIGGHTYFFKSNGKPAVGGTVINNKVYVFDSKARLLKPSEPRFVRVGKYYYYVDKSGIASTGWMIINDKLYYGDSIGRLKRNTVYENITFGQSCNAESDTEANLKMQVMRIVSNICQPQMTSYQKLWACWNYVVSGRIRYFPYYPNYSDATWYKDLALKALANGLGNCYGYACAFAALAKEVGFQPYVVCGRVSGYRDGASDGMTRHCWVMINGAYYDPEAQYAGWYRGVYGSYHYDIAHSIQRTVLF